MIKQIGLPLRGRLILLITRMITDRIGLHSVLLPLLIYSCTKYGIPGMCFHIFPTCDPLTRDAKPRLCREDCYALFEDVCLVELQFAAFDPKFKKVLPDCSALPKRGSKDHSYCKSIGIPGR